MMHHFHYVKEEVITTLRLSDSARADHNQGLWLEWLKNKTDPALRVNPVFPYSDDRHCGKSKARKSQGATEQFQVFGKMETPSWMGRTPVFCAGHTVDA